ncbi:MAG: DUF1049 domain-containing protein [Alphaproteobacteria bacterium]|nr:DUF1049 domain-containing protein [Alphaproteobacteria bacterium]
MGLIRTIFGFVLAIALTVFAILNQQSVSVILSPVHDAVEMPLYLIALYMLGTGFFIGALTVWLNSGSLRRLKRRQRKTIKTLEKELKDIKETKPPSAPPPADFFPALPKP